MPGQLKAGNTDYTNNNPTEISYEAPAEKDNKSIDWPWSKKTKTIHKKVKTEAEADKLKVSQFEDAKSLSGFPERELILPKDLVNSSFSSSMVAWFALSISTKFLFDEQLTKIKSTNIFHLFI